MSFSFEFVATQTDALKIVEQEHAPDCVKEFLCGGLAAFGPDALVSVKAFGHLYNKNYDRSSATLGVQELCMRLPKGPMRSGQGAPGGVATTDKNSGALNAAASRMPICPAVSLEDFLQKWASEHVSAKAREETEQTSCSPFVFARYQVGELAKVLREAGYVR